MNSLPPRIYLASRSPRRRELLRQLNVQFDVLLFRSGERSDLDVNEDPLPNEGVLDYVQRIARAKAEGGWKRLALRHLPIHPVLSADTTLDLDGVIIGKPTDADDAARILKSLSDRTHRVLTSVAMCDGNRLEHITSVSDVRFTQLSEPDIARYVASGEPMDKAGAYGIQGRAGMFVEEIRGSYTGIMGLPLFETCTLLKSFGYPV